MKGLRLYLFGAPRLERDGLPLTTDTRKATALLAYLAVTQRRHTRDTLATLLWGDADQQHARGALRRTLSVLRSAVGEGVVESSGDTVSFGTGLWCDVTAFRGGLRQGELAGAAELFRAPFMSGFSLRDSPDFEEWQFLEGEALNRELAEALTRLAGELTGNGDYKAALVHARRLLALDPLNEEGHRLLMRLYAYSGDAVAALRQYRECVRILEQELGVAPLSETTELYQSIRENRLARPAPAGPSLPSSASVHHREQELPERTGPARTRLLAGRAGEWATLTRAYEGRARTGYCLALEGEAGIGKTRLAADFLDHVRNHGGQVAAGRCYEGETGIAYGVIIPVLRSLIGEPGCRDRLATADPAALAEAARLLPELVAAASPATPSLSEPGAAVRFMEGLRRFVVGACPGPAPTVLFFDDLHWADAASLDFVIYLVRRLEGLRLFVLLAWRTDGSPQVERLRALFAEASRSRQGALLPLGRLKLADVVQLVEERAAEGISLADGVAGRIYHESEGVPLFVMAYLDSATGEAPGGELPASIRDALAARLRGAGETEQQLLGAAAVLGRSFDLDVLQATSGRTADETLTGLERLTGRGLIHEALGGGPAVVYDFDHEKLRDLVYEGTSLARRRLLHERAGRALVAVGSRRRTSEIVAAPAAYHFAQAGMEAEAAEQYLLAAYQAERVYANLDALAHYRRALAYGHQDQATLHEKIGDLETLRGEYRAALASYEAAVAYTQHGSTSAAGLEHKLGNLHARLGDWEAAESFYASAERWLAEEAYDCLARLCADWSAAAYQRGDAARAEELALRALEHANRTRDPQSLAQAHNVAGILQRARGDVEAAITSLGQSRDFAEQSGHPGLRAAALNNLALATADRDIGQAVGLLQSALSLCVRHGDRHREAALRNNLADLLHASGRNDEAMEELMRAVALFAEVGLQAGEARAEIWKLTEW